MSPTERQRRLAEILARAGRPAPARAADYLAPVYRRQARWIEQQLRDRAAEPGRDVLETVVETLEQVAQP